MPSRAAIARCAEPGPHVMRPATSEMDTRDRRAKRTSSSGPTCPSTFQHSSRGAYAWPETFADAKAEFDYWTVRREEMEVVLGPDGYGDSGLDMVADLRRDMLRDLVEHELPTMTLADLHARFAYLRELDSIDKDLIKDALFRDLTTMVAREGHPSNVSTSSTVRKPDSFGRAGIRPRLSTRHRRRHAARRSQSQRSAHRAGMRLLAYDCRQDSPRPRHRREDPICPAAWTDVLHQGRERRGRIGGPSMINVTYRTRLEGDPTETKWHKVEFRHGVAVPLDPAEHAHIIEAARLNPWFTVEGEDPANHGDITTVELEAVSDLDADEDHDEQPDGDTDADEDGQDGSGEAADGQITSVQKEQAQAALEARLASSWADLLRADPTQSDRSIAAACGCSKSTVARTRKDLIDASEPAA